ncbi:MAG TPA: 5'/3'-nucleotidase SurE [Catalimonadaceae bacterium]|nr:5'/3'-nucleotidase SurE [Catalimonadaceae bacterium]
MSNTNQKPLILISNDDGIYAKGISSLIDFVKDLGEVVVVAPTYPQSGMGHAITIHEHIRLDAFKLYEGVEAYECSGTPVDCVKLAKHHILKDRRPDLVLSGINHGSNSSVSVIYSGTMSAAIEGAMEGIPSLGFSLSNFDHNADFEPCRRYVREIVKSALQNPFPDHVALNVNFPNLASSDIKGIKVCRQAFARWKEEFENRKDPRGRDYFWLSGSFTNLDNGSDTDEAALAEGFVSVVPCHFDLTSFKSIEMVKSMFGG